MCPTQCLRGSPAGWSPSFPQQLAAHEAPSIDLLLSLRHPDSLIVLPSIASQRNYFQCNPSVRVSLRGSNIRQSCKAVCTERKRRAFSYQSSRFSQTHITRRRAGVEVGAILTSPPMGGETSQEVRKWTRSPHTGSQTKQPPNPLSPDAPKRLAIRGFGQEPLGLWSR